eukprot:427001_1
MIGSSPLFFGVDAEYPQDRLISKKKFSISGNSLQYVDQTKNLKCYHQSLSLSPLQFAKYLIKLLGQCPSTLVYHTAYNNLIQQQSSPIALFLIKQQNKTLCQDCRLLLLLYSNQFWSFDYVRTYCIERYDPIPLLNKYPQRTVDIYYSIKNISEITYQIFRVPSICKQFAQHKQLLIASFRHCFYLCTIATRVYNRFITDLNLMLKRLHRDVKNVAETNLLIDIHNFGRCTMQFMISIMNQIAFYCKRKQLKWLIKDGVIEWFVHLYEKEMEPQ